MNTERLVSKSYSFIWEPTEIKLTNCCDHLFEVHDWGLECKILLNSYEQTQIRQPARKVSRMACRERGAMLYLYLSSGWLSLSDDTKVDRSNHRCQNKANIKVSIDSSRGQNQLHSNIHYTAITSSLVN